MRAALVIGAFAGVIAAVIAAEPVQRCNDGAYDGMCHYVTGNSLGAVILGVFAIACLVGAIMAYSYEDSE